MRLKLFDIDGTLADDRHRVQFALQRDWNNYFDPETMLRDTVLPEGRELMNFWRPKSDAVGYLTTRRDDLRTTTEKWLWENGFPFAPLFMRPLDVKRPAANLKAEAIQRILDAGVFTDVVLFDDDPEIVKFVNKTTPARAELITYYVKEKALVKTPAL